ncbi:MAG: FMN-binding protein [Candidatus Paceibacterota bacterium]|jgi:uncharacterized protein with FMN-binding domain
MTRIRKTPVLARLTLSLGLLFVSAVYAAWQNLNGQRALPSPSQEFKNANEALQQTLSGTGQPTAATPSRGPSPMMRGPMMAGRYTDGSYTGPVVDAYYGMLQVQAVIQNGRIADVVFLRHADAQENSRFINNQAMPLLTQEAITAQSAQVDGVSGATFTSEAFKKSLSGALALATK